MTRGVVNLASYSQGQPASTRNGYSHDCHLEQECDGIDEP